MEIIVSVVDKQQPDPKLAPMAIKRGHVIDIRPDGWAWSEYELTNPDWRIISVPITPLIAAALLSPPIENMPLVQPTGIADLRKKFALDLSAFPNPADFIGKRTKSIVTLTLTDIQSASVLNSTATAVPSLV